MPLEILDWVEDAFAGWRYLISSSFRQRTHKRWKVDGRGKVFIEVLFGGLGVIVSLLLFCVAIVLLTG